MKNIVKSAFVATVLASSVSAHAYTAQEYTMCAALEFTMAQIVPARRVDFQVHGQAFVQAAKEGGNANAFAQAQAKADDFLGALRSGNPNAASLITSNHAQCESLFKK